MNHLELFAGIGGFRRALDLLDKDRVMKFNCVGFSEIDENAIKTYKANYTIGEEEVEIGDIVSFSNDSDRILSLPHFDLITGGFPCQTFSMMGNQQGFNEDRGQMFFRIKAILDVLKEHNRLPRYLLLENVKNLVSHDHGNTFRVIASELGKLGYNVYPNIFNTAYFGLPQTRNRVLIFCTLDELPIDFVNTYTPEAVYEYYDKYIRPKRKSIRHFKSVNDILVKKVAKKYFLSEKIKPTILSDGSGGFKSRSIIDLKVARPLTASMHKMHRACQDNYYSQQFIESRGKNPVDPEMPKGEQAKLPIRKLTPKEAMMLQGFPQTFAGKATKVGVSDGSLYKQAGNAVSVNTIYAVLRYLIKNKYIIE